METLIYEKLDDHRVRCGICRHFCVIKPGKRGICGVRENRAGQLITLVYPRVIASSIDPIEKKPLFHIKPGSRSYSIATVGCNFKCAFCQNADIAQMPADNNGMIQGRQIRPESIVQDALNAGCDSIAYTYTEPTVFFELAMETARLARRQGLLNVFVTNGYMSEQALDMAAPFMDAANVDLKAFNDQFYQTWCKARIEPVKENIKQMKAAGILVEITTLLIPGLNDDATEIHALAEFIAREVGVETPWHISRFHPCYKLTDRPSTPASALETAYEAGKAAGLRYVYIGNVPGHGFENTHCHSCNELLVERYGYTVTSHMLAGGKCPVCQAVAHGIY